MWKYIQLTLPIFWFNSMSSLRSSQSGRRMAFLRIASDFLVTGTPLWCWFKINSWTVGNTSPSNRYPSLKSIPKLVKYLQKILSEHVFGRRQNYSDYSPKHDSENSASISINIIQMHCFYWTNILQSAILSFFKLLKLPLCKISNRDSKH